MKLNVKEAITNQVEMKMKRSSIGLLMIILLIGLPSCDILQQTAEIQRLSQCKFDLNGVEKVKLAGINLHEGMSRSDLNASQILQLTNALFSNKLPLSFDLLVKVDNPNDKTAAISRMDYSLIIDGLELVSGNLNQRYEVGASSATVIPLLINLDLFQALSEQNIETISNLAFKLTGSNSYPVNILFRVKPYIMVGSSQLAYPGFIDINHTL